jgi:hypothetical protein
MGCGGNQPSSVLRPVRRPAKARRRQMRIQPPASTHLTSMHGKGLTRLVVAIATFVLGAGVTLGAMGLPILMALQR